MEKEKVVEFKKIFSKLLKEAKSEAKNDECFVCHKKSSSFKNSHTVPQFVLREISDEGHVMMGGSFVGAVNEIVEDEKGVHNASSFFLLCDECENKLFKDYEDPDFITDLFEDLNNKTIKKESVIKLVEIFLKSLLKEIYTKTILDNNLHVKIAEKALNQGLIQGTNNEEIASLTLRDYKLDIDQCFKILEDPQPSDVCIYYHYVLPYKTQFATQTLICLRRDLANQQVNDINNDDPNIKMEDICTLVFPIKNKTYISIFGLRSSKEIYSTFFKQFNKLNNQRKLKAMQTIIFSHSEEIYLSKELKEIIKQDSSFAKIASQEIAPIPVPRLDGGICLAMGLTRIDNFEDAANCYFDRKFAKR